MKLRIEKSLPKGDLYAPSSKSAAHRALICAGLCDGESVIENISLSQDIEATLNCLKAIGCNVEIRGGTVKIRGIKNFERIGKEELYCSESGSTLRFFIPICLLADSRAILRGSEKLISRPLGVYSEICRKQGVEMAVGRDTVELNGKLRADTFEVKGNISSQFISGLMFALPQLEGDSVIKIIPPFESRPYVYMTADMINKFGVEAEINENEIKIRGSQKYRPCNLTVEGDWSNAAFLYALKEYSDNLEIHGVDKNSMQGDKVCTEYFKKLKQGFCTLDVTDCPDLAPVLFAFGAANYGAEFTGTDRLRLKESDRIACMKEELEKFGAELFEGENKVRISSCGLRKPERTIYGHNDHRIVMATAFLLMLTGGELDGAEAVRKSYPDFFEQMIKSGVKIDYLND